MLLLHIMLKDLLINKKDHFDNYINDNVYLIEMKKQIIKKNLMIMNKEIMVENILLYIDRLFVDDNKTK